jgi:hypothetical protein
MKFLIVLSLCLFSVNLFSNSKDHKELGEKFDKMTFADLKKLKLEMLDKKITMIEQERTCVNSAQDRP